MSLETIVRPFSDDPGVTPVRQLKAGVNGVPPVLLMIGRKGGTKTLAFSGNFTLSSYLARVHRERPDVNSLLR